MADENKYLSLHGTSYLKDKIIEYLKEYTDAKISETLTQSDSVTQYASIYNFPNVGKENALYIDKSSNKTYRWDDANVKYYCVGSDFSNIEVINGGNSN